MKVFIYTSSFSNKFNESNECKALKVKLSDDSKIEFTNSNRNNIKGHVVDLSDTELDYYAKSNGCSSFLRVYVTVRYNDKSEERVLIFNKNLRNS